MILGMDLRKRFCYSLVFTLLSFSPSPAIAEIYKWVDENGKTQFSDKKPKSVKAQDIEDKLEGNFLHSNESEVLALDARQKQRQLKLGFEYSGYWLDKLEESDLELVIHKMYDTYEMVFNWPSDKEFQIRLTFVDRKLYHQIDKQNGVWGNSNGFYLPRTNQAYIKGNSDRRATIETAIHEASHAILHARVNWVPNWINEGLAEYFESAHIKGGSFNVAMPKHKIKSLQFINENKILSQLDEFFSIPNQEWRVAAQREQGNHYLTAWALVSFMMSTEPGRELLADVLEAAKSRPHNFDARTIINDRYENGYVGFVKAWQKWVDRI